VEPEHFDQAGGYAMRRLTCVRRDDQGAIVVIVALFMFFVAFGSAAMTIDVGNTNTDRRQRQNGVDAVALAVTKQCAEHAPHWEPRFRRLRRQDCQIGRIRG
jgi:uncharacterized membrane protein